MQLLIVAVGKARGSVEHKLAQEFVLSFRKFNICIEITHNCFPKLCNIDEMLICFSFRQHELFSHKIDV